MLMGSLLTLVFNAVLILLLSPLSSAQKPRRWHMTQMVFSAGPQSRCPRAWWQRFLLRPLQAQLARAIESRDSIRTCAALEEAKGRLLRFGPAYFERDSEPLARLCVSASEALPPAVSYDVTVLAADLLGTLALSDGSETPLIELGALRLLVCAIRLVASAHDDDAVRRLCETGWLGTELNCSGSLLSGISNLVCGQDTDGFGRKAKAHEAGVIEAAILLMRAEADVSPTQDEAMRLFASMMLGSEVDPDSVFWGADAMEMVEDTRRRRQQLADSGAVVLAVQAMRRFPELRGYAHQNPIGFSGGARMFLLGLRTSDGAGGLMRAFDEAGGDPAWLGGPQ